MDLDRFYDIIEQAREEHGPTAPPADESALRDLLDELPDEEVAGFAERFQSELVRLNRWSVWGAGYVADDGMSDDGFHYFRSWLIGKGRDAVETALIDPDDLVEFLGEDEELDAEGLEYQALEILQERELPDPRDESSADGDPEGEPFDEETVQRSYPRLAAAGAGG